MTSADVVLPAGYDQTLKTLNNRVREARQRTLRTVNTELIQLYWHIGHEIRSQQEQQGWGSKVVQQLAEDLRAEFPDMTGLSRSNLQYMRAFAGAWTSESIVQQAVGQLPWGHIITLLDKLDDEAARQWYAAASVEYGWSRNVLLNMIMNQSMQSTGVAASNFARQLSSPLPNSSSR